MSTDISTLLEKSVANLESMTARMAALESKNAEQDGAIRELSQRQQGAEVFGGGSGRADVFAKAIEAARPTLRALREREQKSGIIRLDHGINLLRKSVLVGDGSTSDANFDVQANRERRIVGEDPRRRVSLVEQLPRIPVTSNSYEFNRLDSYVANAGFQANEGAVKPEQDTDFALQNVSIPTIAILQPISQQLLADEPSLRFMLQGLLTYGCIRKLEDEIIEGSTRINGIQNQATAYSASSDEPLADSIGAMAAELDEAGWNATHVLLNPADWQAIRSERAQDGQYVAAGWAVPNAPSIWGLAVVTSPAVTAGRPVVLDASQIALLDREQARVEFGYVSDQFARNLITARCELRASVAVFSPTAVRRLA